MKEDTAKDINPLIEEMFGSGAHYGFSRAKRHPSAKPYIFGSKERIDIINLEKTLEQLERAKEHMKALGAERRTVLFVGTKNEGKDIVRNTAQAIGMPYVVNRWIGGTFTNFGEIKKRLTRLKELKEGKERGTLAKYTKKEQLLLDREAENLERDFGGIVGMDELPAAMFVLDARHEHIAVKEARRAGIPVVSLSGPDADLARITRPIVANDAAVPSISFFMRHLAEAFEEGKKSAPEAKKEEGKEAPRE